LKQDAPTNGLTAIVQNALIVVIIIPSPAFRPRRIHAAKGEI
jgi:hypothetical protein